MVVAIAFFVYIAAGNEFRMVQIQEQAKNPDADDQPPPGGWPGRGGDQVTIGPPPYARRGRSRREIRHLDDA